MQSLPKFCLLLLSLFFSALARGQVISFSVKDASLEKVFLLIEQQCNYHFIYSSEQLARARSVTLTVQREDLRTVLDKCFAGQPLSYTLNERHIVVKEKTANSNDRPLSGKVINDEGLPIAGVTVTVKGSSNQVATDKEGIFSFASVAPHAILVISGAEIETHEVNSGTQLFVNVQVKTKLGTLDEAYVIAYGKATRRLATGTVTSIKKQDIEKQPVSNPLSVLAGTVAGLQVTQASGTPGSPFTVRLRGQNSLANGNDPLVLVDGIPYPFQSLFASPGGGINASPLATLNTQDIESIEVLKDADATAIYGSRGANGVILISTRRPTAGKTRVNLRSYAGFGKPTRFMDLLNTSDYLRMRREAFSNDGITPTIANAPDLLLWDTTRYKDWQEVLIGRTMHVADTKLEFSGGTTQTQFLFGTGFHDESTVLPLKSFGERKLSTSLNISHLSGDNRLKFTTASTFSRNVTKLPQEDLAGYVISAPNAPSVYTTDGKLNWENSTWSNPFGQLYKRFFSESEMLGFNMSLSWNPIASLELKASTGYSKLQVQSHSTSPSTSFDPLLNYQLVASFGNSFVSTLVIEPQAQWKNKYGHFGLQLLAGSTIQSTRQQSRHQTGLGYASDDLLGSISAAPTVTTGGEADIKYRYLGSFGRLNVDWKQKLLFSLTGRRDGSSRYGPGNRFANFGSAALAWVFTKEPWMDNQQIISFGKIKLSAGTTGNDQIGDYKYLDLYGPVVGNYQGVVAFQPIQLFNPDYSWEMVKKWESGIDIGFLKDRILIAFRYYHNETGNQLVQYGLPPSTGFAGILRNLPAKIRNTGIELELSGTLLQYKQFNWNTAFNITVPQNKLVSFENFMSSSYANTYIIGEPLQVIRRYRSEGVDPSSGHYLFTDFNNDGKISSPDDMQSTVFTGQQFFGGWQNSVRWKRFNFSVFFQFVKQKYGGNYLFRFNRPGILNNQPALVSDRWQKPGDTRPIQRYSFSGAIPSLAYANLKQSDAAYSDASFIRLRNLFISWNVFSKDTKIRLLKECSLFIQGQNLITISDYIGADPETKTIMPPTKMMTFGINCTF